MKKGKQKVGNLHKKLAGHFRGHRVFDKVARYIHNVIHSSDGEIKPFGYRIRRFFLERVFKMEAQKRVKGKEPFAYDEDDSSVQREAEQVALAAYFSIDLPDNERLILIESYCKTCKNKTIRIFSNKTRRLICTGCGRELAKL